MASRTRDQLRELVRTQLDMDDTELPDATLDTWLEDAFERSLAVEDRWPFFEYDWTITTVADQLAYTKASLAALDASQYAIDQIISLEDITDYPFEVKGISHDRAKAVFGLGTNAGGIPAFWSEWKSSIYLWPVPADVRTIRVDGYRKPSWGSGDSSAPDCDERLHICLFYFACAMAYAQQEDEVLKQQYIQDWQAALSQAHKKIMATPQRRPVVMSGGLETNWRVPVAVISP